jgi:hypothetical protein
LLSSNRYTDKLKTDTSRIGYPFFLLAAKGAVLLMDDEDAPSVLYGCGEIGILGTGGLAI